MEPAEGQARLVDAVRERRSRRARSSFAASARAGTPSTGRPRSSTSFRLPRGGARAPARARAVAGDDRPALLRTAPRARPGGLLRPHGRTVSTASTSGSTSSRSPTSPPCSRSSSAAGANPLRVTHPWQLRRPRRDRPRTDPRADRARGGSPRRAHAAARGPCTSAPARASPAASPPPTRCATRGRSTSPAAYGAKVWDVDGNELLDFHNGFGSMVQGHAHPAIGKAVTERYPLGTHFAAPTEDGDRRRRGARAPLGPAEMALRELGLRGDHGRDPDRPRGSPAATRSSRSSAPTTATTTT